MNLGAIPRGSMFLCCLAFSFGCGGASYMPLDEGREWKYLVSTPGGSSVATLKVVERARVGLTNGWKISGPAGENRMAWSGGELLVSDLSAMRFDPPIALLMAGSDEANWTWKGKCRSRGAYADASAECSQKTDKIKLGGTDRECLMSVVRLSFRDSVIELRSWFQSGIGIVRQEQHIDGRLTTALEWIGGS